MINAEFYKEDILKYTNRNETFALNKKNEIICCCNTSTSCMDCKWNEKSRQCECLKMEWLFEEHKEYPKLTRYEKETLERMNNSNYSLFARNLDGGIFACEDGMIRMAKNWEDRGNRETSHETSHVFVSDFSFAKWTDKEPWNIQDLLENCEVEE